jgi:surfactin synthase thioesterase subunit
MVLPLLRADFALSDTVLPAEPVRCPISVWSATEDPYVTEERLERWRELTTLECRVRQFPGSHFFIRTAWEQVVEALREELPGWCPAGR